MIEIPLTKGQTAIVDDEDGDLVAFKWHARSVDEPYAQREITRNYVTEYISMHRVIMERILGRPLDKSEQVDHRNLKHSDNRRENLRLASFEESARNRGKPKNQPNRYKGITKRGSCFLAQIQCSGKKIILGRYDTEEEAAIAYNHAAKELFGEYAAFNPIENWETIKPTPKNPLTSLSVRNKSGYQGVSFNQNNQKWTAYFKKKYIGYFDSPEAAYAARELKVEEWIKQNRQGNDGSKS